MPGPERKFTSSALQIIARRFWLAAITVSSPVVTANAMTSAPSDGRANRRPERVDTSRNPSSPKRRAYPSLVTARPCSFGAASGFFSLTAVAFGGRARSSIDRAATTRSPSFSLNSFWIGSP